MQALEYREERERGGGLHSIVAKNRREIRTTPLDCPSSRRQQYPRHHRCTKRSHGTIPRSVRRPHTARTSRALRKRDVSTYPFKSPRDTERAPIAVADTVCGDHTGVDWDKNKHTETHFMSVSFPHNRLTQLCPSLPPRYSGMLQSYGLLSWQTPAAAANMHKREQESAQIARARGCKHPLRP